MRIVSGTKLGRYEIRSKIGEGGMGEVYHARDTRLNRDVAVKVLPAAFSADLDRLRRFELEAQAASALNHPNILSVYDFGELDGAPYVVSELLEGVTLRERLGANVSSTQPGKFQDGMPLSERKALDYALQIAQGLAAAHAKGIVHRDLKPDNLFITSDGRVKILDFGLAKLTGTSDGTESQTDVPTRRVDTDPGIVMGTMGYMSPEQLRGKPADHRSDLFSFGAILYEMLSGNRAFRGDSVAETMSAILREDPPDLSKTNNTISPALERVVRHCLEKNPDERFHSARDLAFAIGSLTDSLTSSGQTITTSGVTTATDRNRSLSISQQFRNAWLPWTIAGALLLALLAALLFAVSSFRRSSAETPLIRFSVPLPEKATIYSDVETHNLSVSPDGRQVVFVAMAEGQRKLWIRRIAEVATQALPGTEGAYSPFWSPDSRYIAFFAAGKLLRIEPSGKSPQIICDLSSELDTTGTWGRNGVILYGDLVDNEQRIYSVAAGGGTPTLLPKTEGSVPYWMHFLPDGKHYLFYARKENPEARGIYVASLDSTQTKLLVPAVRSRVEYASGHLLYAREGSLLAQPFDEQSLQISGEPFTVVERLLYFDKTGWSEFSVSENGVLAYMTEFPPTRVVWLDRSGRETEQVGPLGLYIQVRLSPDGQRLALTVAELRTFSGDLWIHDLARDTSTRFAFGSSDDGDPVWSPDGSRMAYFSCCDDKSSLYIKAISETAKGEVPLPQGFHGPSDWSMDGRFILFTQNPAEKKRDLWVLPLGGDDRKPFPLLQSPFHEVFGRFSPDVRWVAFVSNETGRDEVYVTRFDQPGEKWRISNAGGTSPCWRRDGKELFFLATDRSVMSVAVRGGDKFEFGTPTPLFRIDSIFNESFDVTADGQRFISISTAAQTQTAPLTVVVNWTADLKR